MTDCYTDEQKEILRECAYLGIEPHIGLPVNTITESSVLTAINTEVHKCINQGLLPSTPKAKAHSLDITDFGIEVFFFAEDDAQLLVKFEFSDHYWLESRSPSYSPDNITVEAEATYTTKRT